MEGEFIGLLHGIVLRGCSLDSVVMSAALEPITPVRL